MKNILFILMLVSASLLSQTILYVSKDYVLIDTDQNIGSIGEKLKVFREIDGRYQNIGLVQIEKFQNGKSAAKIIYSKTPLQKYDQVQKTSDKSIKSNQQQPVKSSLGIHYHRISFLGESRDDFLMARGAELTFEQRFGNYFALRGILNYAYMEWEWFVGSDKIGIYQYAEPEVYGVSISPALRLPIVRNTVELSIAPIFGLSLVSVWYEVDSGIPSFTFQKAGELEPETKFSFGTDAALRVNIFKRLGLEAGVRWQNLDVLGGFADYNVVPVDIPSSIPLPELNVDVTTLVYRFGLLVHL